MPQPLESLFKEQVTIGFGPSSLMANYSRIKKVTPSQSRLVVEVGGNRGVKEGEVNNRSRRKDWEAEKRSSKRIRWRKCAQEQDGSRLPSLSTDCRDTQGPIIAQGRVAGVGSGYLGAVNRCSGGVPYHHYSLTRIGNLEVFFVSLSLLSFLLCNYNKIL